MAFSPANAKGDDITVWSDDSRTTERARFHTLCQQLAKETQKPHVALSDFVASSGSDYVGSFVVGIHGADEWAKEVSEKETDPYKAIMIKAVADRLVEAFAELLHHRARVEWGYERPNEFNHNELIKELYRGIRPAPGYPAQLDHTEKPVLFDLLEASESHAHRKLRHASRGRCFWTVVLPPRESILCDQRATEGSGGRLCQAQELEH